MSLATWWVNDPLPALPALPDFVARLASNDVELAALNQISVIDVRSRRTGGHQAYIGYLQGLPVTYGWVATRTASIGELDLAFALPPGDRYLWDFATLPEWQGRGLYPRLLQAIAVSEAAIAASEAGVAQRLWIIHAPENLPSGAGMHKAGFESVGQLSFRAEGGVGLAPTGLAARAQAGATLLGVSLIETVLAPCWHCGNVTQTRVAADSCWPPVRPNSVQCTCATKINRSLLTT